MSDFISIVFSSIIQLLVFILIPFVWWMITARDTNFFQWIGLKRPVFSGSRVKVALIIVIVVCSYIGAMYLIMSTALKDVPAATGQFSNKGLIAIPSILVYAFIQTGLSEELFFRGFLCKRLSVRFRFKIGNSMQSILFGLLHGIPFGLASGKWYVAILLTILPAFIGYIQGWVNEKKANGSIIPSWIIHGLMNLLSALLTV